MKLSATQQRLIFYGGLTGLLSGSYLYATTMPGRSHREKLPGESPEIHAAALELKTHVAGLAGVVGERRVGEGESLARARDYVASELGIAARAIDTGIVLEPLGSDGSDAANVILELRGQSSDTVVIGAHYDSAPGTPGANDNASGVAIGLYLVKRLGMERLRNTLRFVFFANEEPPYFQNPGMGSLAHARGCAERKDRILAMLALESLGYYSDEPDSQRYPWPVGLLYPDRGNFVGFVGNLGSRSLVREAIRIFRHSAQFPSEGAALPGWIPGVGWSDHWSFWQFDYPAIMVTDTAVYRDPNYHEISDVPRNLNYSHMARVAFGLLDVIRGLARADGLGSGN
jgi:hypothetical protein